MGKGTITAELGSGHYTVTLVYAGRARVNGWIADLTAKIAALTTVIAGMDEGLEKTIAELRLQGMIKRRSYYQAKMPDDRSINAWCVDLTTGLTGDVGTIEVAGERSGGVNIQPGYDGNAVYNASRDGQLLPAVATTAAAAYFNRAIMPGWQKHLPTFRYGVIVADSIDFDGNTCDVCLDPTYSSQLNLDINQDQGFSQCEATPPAGFTEFCAENPTHPTCTVTEPPGSLYVSDADYATIRSVNRQVNSEHDYLTDKSGYGVGDYWTIMEEGDAGDCEDFALTKMQALIDAGFSAANLQLAWCYDETGTAHAVLIIQTVNRGTLVLDNRYEAVMQIANVPYRFEAYQRAGATWASYTVRLETVPIEYMTCNAYAFADGDAVVVEFTGQDWTQPTVIGFKSDPQACELMFYCFFGYNPTGTLDNCFRVNLTTQAVTTIADPEPSADANCNDVSSFAYGGAMYIVGGWTLTTPQRILDRNLKFSYATFSYATMTALPAPDRACSAGYTLAGKGYIASGGKYYDASQGDGFLTGNVYDDTDEYDPSADSWTAKTACPISRMSARGFVLAGKGHILGGHDDWYLYDGQSHRDIKSGHYAYDPTADAWSAKTDINESRTGAVGCHIDGKGYLFGGWVQDGLDNDTTIVNRSYDADTDAWSLISHFAPANPLTAFYSQFGRSGGGEIGYLGYGANIYFEYSAAGDSFTQRTIDVASYSRFKRFGTGEIN